MHAAEQEQESEQQAAEDDGKNKAGKKYMDAYHAKEPVLDSYLDLREREREREREIGTLFMQI